VFGDLRRAAREQRLRVERHARAPPRGQAGEALVEGGARVAAAAPAAALGGAEVRGARAQRRPRRRWRRPAPLRGFGRGRVRREREPRLAAAGRDRRTPADERVHLVGGERAVA
jgi:hypothetical protein